MISEPLVRRSASRGAAPTYPFKDVDRLSTMRIGFVS
jgi:hypothetical protein